MHLAWIYPHFPQLQLNNTYRYIIEGHYQYDIADLTLLEMEQGMLP